jgi:hypothetical protein
MNRLFLGVMATVTVFALTSFAIRDSASPGGKLLGAPAWTVSQYQLDRAFRVQVQPGLGGPMTATMPATGGIIITQIRMPLGQFGTLTVIVNGAAEPFSVPQNGPAAFDLNPPIIARPNDVVTILADTSATWVIAGYTTMPGET